LASRSYRSAAKQRLLVNERCAIIRDLSSVLYAKFKLVR